MVVLEAAHAGVPIVAPRVGEITGDDGTFLVDAERPNQLAGLLETVRSRPAEAAGRAPRARARVRSFYAVEPWARRPAALYAEAIASTCRAHGGPRPRG